MATIKNSYCAPATSIQIQELEIRNQLNFPQDFRTYLLTANGFVNHDCDNSMISFWSIEEFELVVNDKNPKETYVLFADFLIQSHHYAIKLLPSDSADFGSIWAIADPHFTKVAETFEDFIRLYLTPYQGDFGNKVLNLKF